MMKCKELFMNSWRELKNKKSLVTTAMLLAVAVVLGFFSVQVTDFIKIGFANMANELTAMLFGPVVGSLMAGAADILKYVIRPTGPFFPGFTISAFAGGLIYGIVLYKRPVSLKRIFLAQMLVTVGVNLFLNTYWLSAMYGNAFTVLLPVRAMKELVMVPIETLLFYTVAMALKKAKAFSAIGVKA